MKLLALAQLSSLHCSHLGWEPVNGRLSLFLLLFTSPPLSFPFLLFFPSTCSCSVSVPFKWNKNCGEKEAKVPWSKTWNLGLALCHSMLKDWLELELLYCLLHTLPMCLGGSRWQFKYLGSYHQHGDCGQSSLWPWHNPFMAVVLWLLGKWSN